MSHIDEDKLLGYVLEVIERQSERDEIAEHLAGCAECRARLEEIRGDVELIGNVRPYGQVLRISNPRAQRWGVYPVLRAAAMIVLGIFVGFGASSLVHHRPTEVVPPYAVLSPPADCSSGCAATDVTDVPPQYYQRLLGSGE
jgi:hypothetical protein